jgi:hypothetical protein
VLIASLATFAIRCPQCGRLEMNTVSRFACSGRNGSVRVACSCGTHKLTVSARREQVAVQIPCYLCDGLHFMYFTPRTFWNGHLTPVFCPETDLQVGVFGPEGEVEVYARTGGTELDRLLEDEAFSEYFDHPEVMYEALSRVHNMAEEGNLSCVCGNRQIGVDIYPERLELCCSECGRRKTVMAAHEEDLALLDSTIEVGSDASGRRKGHKK